ncbi:hypothetical protein MAUB1S_08498 [Mycolicibacterium aubagnense]
MRTETSLVMRSWRLFRPVPVPLLAASAFGWLLLTGYSAVTPLSSLCLSVTRLDQVISAQLKASLLLIEPSKLAVSWLIMLLAMMPPLLAAPLLHVWRRSLNAQRPRAIGLFILGYTATWLMAGVILAAAAIVLASLGFVTGLPVLVVTAVPALLWQATPIKQFGLNRCHGQPPLAAFGPRAALAALRYGAGHGFWCTSTCWALMLLAMVAEGPWHWPVMGAVAVVLTRERYHTPRSARWGAALPQWLMAGPPQASIP